MPRRSNTSAENARRRRNIRIDVISRHENLRNEIRNVGNLDRRANVSRIEKEIAKDRLVMKAMRVFIEAGHRNALPMLRSKIVEKLMSAWPYAVQRAMNRRRQQPGGQSPRRVTLPPFRNVSLARTASGKQAIFYFPNN